MPQIIATASAVLEASPDVLYGIIADYREGHAYIVPPKYFSDLVVERGGVGAGTVIRFKLRMAGKTEHLRAIVSEPVPGRVLVETYPDTGGVTTFTVAPADARHTRVTFHTTWAKSGFAGLMEKLLAPLLLRRIYAEELQRLADFARQRATVPA